MGVGRTGAIDARERTRARVDVRVSCDARRDGLRTALADAGFDVVDGAASTGDADDTEGGERDDADGVDVVVLDDRRPTWLRSVSAARERHPEAQVVLLFEHEDDDSFLAAIAAGASGFCRLDAPVEGVVRTVQSVLESGAGVPRDKVLPLIEHVRHGRGHTVHTKAGPIEVTDREWEILTLLAQRRSTREIADALFVSVGTVRSHVSTLMKKLGAVDREDVIAMIDRA